jgi:hypothetical protein
MIVRSVCRALGIGMAGEKKNQPDANSEEKPNAKNQRRQLC